MPLVRSTWDDDRTPVEQGQSVSAPRAAPTDDPTRGKLVRLYDWWMQKRGYVWLEDPANARVHGKTGQWIKP